MPNPTDTSPPASTSDLSALRKGEAIEMPVYDFAADNRSPQTITVKPARRSSLCGSVLIFWPCCIEQAE